MSLARIRSEHTRGAILGILKDGDRANDRVLHDAVTLVEAVNVSYDQTRTEIRWLADQGLVEIDEVGSLLSVRITQRGLDFLEGRTFVDGIRRRLS